MKHVSKITAIAALALGLSALSASAEGRGGNGGNNADASAAALAMAGASSTLNAGNTYANGGMGADGCAASVMTPLVGFSLPTCTKLQRAEFALMLINNPKTAKMFSAETYQDVFAAGMGLKVVRDTPTASIAAAPVKKPAATADVTTAKVQGLASCQLKAGKVMVTRGLFTGDARFATAKQECVDALTS